jgi:hypothetical protein
MKFTIEVRFGGERLYVCPFIPDYIDEENQIPKLSKDELPNMITGICNYYRAIYNEDYSLPFQLCVSNHEWIDQEYLNPTKEFIWYVLTQNAKGNFLERYKPTQESWSDPDTIIWKQQSAQKMVKWIEEHSGIETVEFVYSLDT